MSILMDRFLNEIFKHDDNSEKKGVKPDNVLKTIIKKENKQHKAAVEEKETNKQLDTLKSKISRNKKDVPYKAFIDYESFGLICQSYETSVDEMKVLQSIFFQTITILDDENIKCKLAYPRNAYTLGHVKLTTNPRILDCKGISIEEKYEAVISLRNFSIWADDPDYMHDNKFNYHVKLGTTQRKTMKNSEVDDTNSNVPPEIAKNNTMISWNRDKYIDATDRNLKFYQYIKKLLYCNYNEITVVDPFAERFETFTIDVMPEVLHQIKSVKNHPIKKLSTILENDNLREHKATCALIRRMYDTGACSDKALSKLLRLDRSLEGVWFAAKTCKDKDKKADCNVIENMIAASASRIYRGESKTFVNQAASFCRTRNIDDIVPYIPEYTTYTQLMREFIEKINDCATIINRVIITKKNKDIKVTAKAFMPKKDIIEEENKEKVVNDTVKDEDTKENKYKQDIATDDNSDKNDTGDATAINEEKCKHQEVDIENSKKDIKATPDDTGISYIYKDGEFGDYTGAVFSDGTFTTEDSRDPDEPDMSEEEPDFSEANGNTDEPDFND